MLNNYTSNYNNTVNIKPACNGMIQKSHPKSFFYQFKTDSTHVDYLFTSKPVLRRKNHNECWETYMNVIVLQVMCYGNGMMLAELINVEDIE